MSWHRNYAKFCEKKSQIRRNQGFSYFFCWMLEGSRSGSGSIPLTKEQDPDPDPGGPKTCGSGGSGSEFGSGSATLHCINSELYLAKWKWILRSGPKLKMLVKFHRSNGSFPNPLNWWRIRFGTICCWRNTFTTDTLHSWPPPPLPQHKRYSSVHTGRFDLTSSDY